MRADPDIDRGFVRDAAPGGVDHDGAGLHARDAFRRQDRRMLHQFARNAAQNHQDKGDRQNGEDLLARILQQGQQAGQGRAHPLLKKI